ncbi:MAG: hypothetical protein ACT4QB_24065 [Gammaproteobacteria bacterium]
MSHNAHEPLPTSRSSGQRSGASGKAPKPWSAATAAAFLTLGLAPVAQAADGALDPGFGVSSTNPLRCNAAGGIMTCDVAGGRDQLFGMAILLPDGRIVVGGHRTGGVAPDRDVDFAVARFNKNGGLDATFGVGGPDGLDGLETTDVGSDTDEVNALVLQDDDGQEKIVVVGRSGDGGSRTFAVARYTAGGQLDTGFATGGIATPPFPGGGENRAFAVAVQPTDRKIVVAIRSVDNPSGVFVVARFTPQGQLDTSFGGDGFVETSFPDSERATAFAVLVQPDGKIVAGGRAGPDDEDSPLRDQVDFALARYNVDGSLDDGGPDDTTQGDEFGIDGRVKTDFELGRAEIVASLLRQPDGKIVAGGNSTIGDAPRFALARYDVNGNLDQSFGTEGRKTTGFPGQPASMTALILQPGGKLVAAGRSRTGDTSQPSDFALVRYQPNGREDTTFGEDAVDDIGGPPEGVPDGFILTRLGPVNATSSWQAVALQPEGNIVVVGFHRLSSVVNSGADFALARYQSSVVPENLTCQGRPPTVIGTPGDDILVGTEGNDVIHGLEGNDTIIAQGGDDIICGGPGDDLVFGGPGGDAIEGGDGIDELVGDDQFAGGEGPDTLRGGEGDDKLFGFGGNDLLEGDGGNDELVGGPGDDVLNGGPGVDRAFGEDGSDSLAGDADNDTLVGDDPFAGTGGPDVLRGGDGDDRLFGAAGNDQLEGDAGDDELVGGPGDDVVSGGPGVDGLFGEGGADTLAGDTDNDTLVGDTLPSDTAAGPDVLRGGEGNDKLFGAAGDDQLFGDAGRDELDGGPGNDVLDGGLGDDRRLFGGSGNDTIRGGPGRDRLVGDAGRDVLSGGPGDDRLFGGAGRDRLLGGAGKDMMDGQGGSDSGVGGPGRPDQCFSMGPRGACENLGVGSPPKPPKAIPRPPLPVGPGSSPAPTSCPFPQCGA